MKRKFLVSIMMVAMLTCSLTTVASAASEDGSKVKLETTNNEIAPRVAQYVWTDAVVNVRTGPGVKYPVVMTLPKNVRLWITYAQYDEYGNDWYRYSEGHWVCANYMRYTP